MELWNKQFGKYSKLLSYALMALLISTIEAVDDVIDQDNESMDIVKEFFLIFIVLTVVFPIIGRYYNWTITFFKSKLIRYKFPVFFVSVIWVLLNIGLILGLSYISNLINCSNFDLKMDMVFIVSLLLVITFENFWNLIHNKVQLELKNAELIKNHEKAKYQALLNQIDPHFLFNNLNILSYLVHENANKADQFILELGNIYRYILQLNASYLIPLHKELDFINSYIFLLSIRFRDNLNIEVNINEDEKQYFLPPLTLEVLVENAIKHNIIDRDKPLYISIYIVGDKLIVKNNVQIRNEAFFESNKVGLKNLENKFEILGSEIPKISQVDGYFIVEVPLSKSDDI